jgi:phospholipase A1/A2
LQFTFANKIFIGIVCCFASASTGVFAADLGIDANALSQCYAREVLKGHASTTVETIRESCRTELNPTTDLKAQPPVSPSGQQAVDPQTLTTLFEKRLRSELTAWGEPFALILHRPNYFMPVTYQSRHTSSAALNQRVEAQFQVSFKFPLSPPLFDGKLVPFFAYTGKSWWQLYDSDRSRPFREYNHEPELLLTTPGFRGEYFGWRHQISVLGFNHQSNGRSVPESRSWNRITAEALFDKGQSNWAAVKLWYRIPERAKANTQDQGGDDNPLIARFLGYAELKLGDVTANNHVTLTLRRSFHKNGKGAAQLDWSRPTGYAPNLRFYAQFFDGYGESLIDYNKRTRRFGLGFMINDWF